MAATKQGKRVVTEIDPVEKWQSTIDGVIWVHKFDRNGREVEEQVKGGGTIKLLPEERLMNQEMAAEESLDPFMNGFLVPLQLVEDAADYDALKGNPNHLTEGDMTALISSRDLDTLRSSIANVTNAATLQRFLSKANAEDSDATVRQVRVIEGRLNAVLNPPTDPEAEVVEIEAIGAPGHTAFATRAPKSVAPENPGMGRRSRRD